MEKGCVGEEEGCWIRSSDSCRRKPSVGGEDKEGKRRSVSAGVLVWFQKRRPRGWRGREKLGNIEERKGFDADVDGDG